MSITSLLRKALLAVLILTMVSLAGLPSASATWSRPPAPMDPPGWWSVDMDTLAVSRTGGAILLWTSMGPDRTTWELRMRRISPTGVAGPARTLPHDAMSEPRSFSVALDDDGDALIAWERGYAVDGLSGGRVFARRLSRTGVLGPVLTLGRASTISDMPSAALAPGGRGAVVFKEYLRDQTPRWRHVLRRIPISGAPKAPTYLPGYPVATRLVATRQGDFVTAGSRDDGILQATRLRKDGSLVHRYVSADTPFWDGLIDIGVDSTGAAYLTYQATPERGRPQLWNRRWSSSGVLGPAHRVSRSTDAVVRASAATDLEGDTMLAWSAEAAPYNLFARIVRRDGSLGPAQKAGVIKGPKPYAYVPSPAPGLAIDDNGDGVLAWSGVPERDNDITWVRRFGPGGSLGPLVRLADRATAGSVAVTPGGRARVIVNRNERLWLFTGP